MKKIDFDKVCDLVINDDTDTAHALMHEWFVQSSKVIVENILREDNEPEGSTENFGDDDLNTDDGAESDLSSDMMDGGEEGGEGGEDDNLDGGFAPDDSEGTENQEIGASSSLEDKIASLTDTIMDLKAEFQQIMGGGDGMDQDPGMDPDAGMGGDMDGMGGEGGMDDGMGGEGGMGDMGDMGDQGFEDQGEENEMNPEGEPTEESFVDEDIFEELDETFDLEKVDPPKMGGEIGSGGNRNFQDQHTSVLGSKSMSKPVEQRAFQGEPVEVKGPTHKGYDREATPNVKPMKDRKNIRKSAMDDLSGVSKEGNKGAILNSKDGFGAEGTKTGFISSVGKNV